MTKQKHVGFAVGFLVGVVLTVFFWRFMEGVYLKEILSVSETERQASAQNGANTNPAKEALDSQAQGEAPAAFRLDTKLSAQDLEGPASAPVTITEYSDFFCPFCSRVVPAMDQLSQNYRGKIRRVFKHFPLPFHVGADRIHEASECAREQGKFWEFHQVAFGNQAGLRAPDAVQQIATVIGLNLETFKACVDSRKYEPLIQQSIKEGTAKGVSGTPSTFINDFNISGAMPYEFFKQAVDHFLDPSKPLPETPKRQPQGSDGPKEPVVFDDLEGKPTQGPQNAKVTLVEFSDFHCPFCARVTPTIQKLIEAHPNDLKRVWRHLPLPMHPGSITTHIASECAADQGAFWPFHDKMFQHPQESKNPDFLIASAKELKLDQKKFEKCLREETPKAKIQKDMDKAQAIGVHGTPTFFINGKFMPGARSYEEFEQLISDAASKK